MPEQYAEDNNYARFDAAAQKHYRDYETEEHLQSVTVIGAWNVREGHSTGSHCMFEQYAEDNNYARFDTAVQKH